MSFCALLFLFFSFSTLAQPAELVSDDLQPQRVTVMTLDDQTLSYIGESGSEQTLPRDRVLRLRMLTPISNETAQSGPGAAWLVDGQILRGQWDGVIDEETVRWQTFGGRKIELALDQLMVLSLNSSDRPAVERDGDDVLGVINGEQLRGFAETVGDKAIGFVIGEADDAVPLPLDRVAWLAIANDMEKVQAADGMAWATLADGSRLLVKNAKVLRPSETGEAILTGELMLEADQTTLQLPMTEVEVLEPIGKARQLISLNRETAKVVAGGKVFGLDMPPRLDRQGRLHLHAPLSLQYDLPDGASRLSLRASLDLGADITVQRAKLAGMELVIRQGEKELYRQAISDSSRQLQANIEVAAGELTLELDPGVNGPVLDRLVIDSAELLVEQP